MAVPLDDNAVASLPMVGGELKIRYVDAADVDRAATDFGGMGVFIRTQNQAPAFAEFSLIQELPDGVTCDPVQARIVQVVPFGDTPGLVVQFLSVPDSVKSCFDTWRNNQQTPTLPETPAPEPALEEDDPIPAELDDSLQLEPDDPFADLTGPAPLPSPPETEKPQNSARAEADKEQKDKVGKEQDRQSMWEKLRKLPIQDRSRLAARAGKLERSLLIRDHEPNVILFLLKKPSTHTRRGR